MTRLLAALATLSLLCAAPDAVANGKHAEKTLEKLIGKSSSGARRVERKIKASDIAEFRAIMTDTFGPPQSDRSGVQVWEVATPNPGLGQSPVTTVTIGTDAKGRPILIADDRSASVGIARTPTSDGSAGSSVTTTGPATVRPDLAGDHE